MLLNSKDTDNKYDQHAWKIALRSLFQILEKEKGKEFSIIEIRIKKISTLDIWELSWSHRLDN